MLNTDTRSLQRHHFTDVQFLGDLIYLREYLPEVRVFLQWGCSAGEILKKYRLIHVLIRSKCLWPVSKCTLLYLEFSYLSVLNWCTAIESECIRVWFKLWFSINPGFKLLFVDSRKRNWAISALVTAGFEAVGQTSDTVLCHFFAFSWISTKPNS